MKKIKLIEILILLFVIALIFISEYFYIVEGNTEKAIFIGLWPPTILGFLIYINSKIKV
jgi:hypothetical protein